MSLADEAAYFAAFDAGKESAQERIAALEAENAALRERMERAFQAVNDAHEDTFDGDDIGVRRSLSVAKYELQPGDLDPLE